MLDAAHVDRRADARVPEEVFVLELRIFRQHAQPVVALDHSQADAKWIAFHATQRRSNPQPGRRRADGPSPR